MSLVIESEGFTNARKIQRDLIQGLLPMSFESLKEVAIIMIEHAISLLNLHGNIATGDLISSIKILSEDPIKMEVVIGSEEPQAVYIEYGRGPVVPKNAKVLHWIDPDTGEDVFSMYSKEVNAQPFLGPAVIMHTKAFKNLMFVKSIQILRGNG